ncbi:MAG: hypothetical protein AAF682_16900 [Planctomycetota bacterium]
MQRFPSLLPLALAPLLVQARAAGQELTALELDPAGVLAGDYVVDVSAAGTAVGAGVFGGVWPQALRFSDAGPAALAPLPGDVMGEANGINDLGVVVGASTSVSTLGLLTFFDRAVRWDASGGVTDLAAAATGGATLELFRAWDVNDAGQIVGFGRDASIPAGRGFLWDAGVVTEIPPLPGVPASRPTQARGINGAGQVVGYAEDSGGFAHALLWEAGALTDLHDGAGVPGRTSEAWDVNEAGWIAGSADFVADFIDWRVAALWRPDGSVIELGTLGGTVGVAYSVNDHNEVVGNTTTGAGNRGFLWRGGVMVDLNSLIAPASGFTIVEARSISNDGRIVGLGVDGAGLQTVVLVPNPCDGFFQVYGESGPGTGGFPPSLAGFGCPAPGEELLFGIQGGLGGASGAIALGFGAGTLPITPFCDLQVLPLAPATLPITLDGAGAGEGELFFSTPLDAGLSPTDLFLQALFLDPGAPGFVSCTRPLQVHVE